MVARRPVLFSSSKTTGSWAIEFADKHPEASVLGVDLTPIMPDLMPPNCMFEVDDIEKRWEREHGSFDLIHARGLSGCFKDLRTVIEQSFE